MKIRTKIILLFSLVIIVGTAAMGAFSSMTMQGVMVESAQEKLKSDLALARALIDEKMPGAWDARDGKLYKGDKTLNDNTEIVDQIGKLTGDSVTLFMGDTRVATNVMKDGKRAVGTKVADEVAQTVLKGGETFLGEALVVDQLSQTAYEPIKNASGQVIGIWFVGVPNEKFDELTSGFRNDVILFGVVGLVVAIIASAVVAEFNARPLVRLTKAARRVADGELSVDLPPLKRQDEIGQLNGAVLEMVANLQLLIREVNVTATQVASAAGDLSTNTEATTKATEQITTAIHAVATGAEHQVQGATQSAQAMDEMAHGIRKIAETSVEVAEVSMQTASEAEHGDAKVQDAMKQMELISKTVNDSAEGVRKLELRSQEIEKIVEVITSIAQQTNLLALNAAIEAARAGEHGRGFSVVADEVRKLAEQSAESAGQISGLIRTIQDETARSVTSMDEVIREVSSGMSVVHAAGDAFHRILESAKKVADQIQDVTAASEEMSAGSAQVAHGVEAMTQIARDSAHNAEEVAASSEQQLSSIEEIAASADSLSRMAEQLRGLIGKFKV